jgi:hypothetical protein
MGKYKYHHDTKKTIKDIATVFFFLFDKKVYQKNIRTPSNSNKWNLTPFLFLNLALNTLENIIYINRTRKRVP